MVSSESAKNTVGTKMSNHRALTRYNVLVIKYVYTSNYII